ncbi:zeta toxin-domain-containing protein [Triangularia verruculosa]|uniref:Zeta toxin-domain-containing protein n=1 Tax=Triangularia verruculosa TaxID=2587418 RepID=A0AAN7AV62_9PEZI|nr:zeta toxin-domain-containing protein [Triangularia verruculosa]
MAKPTTLSSLPPSWTLTQEQERQIFTTTILPLEITPFIPPTPPTPPSTPPPTAIILLGQTGSGKTRLAPLLSSSLSPSSPPCHLIADTYKTHHPFYSPCLTAHPHLASQLASPSARVWLSMACSAAADAKIPVLVESACRHPSDFSEIVDIFSKAGYLVKVVILAVPKVLSRLGVLVRYHNKLPESMSRGLPLRLTPTKVHDESYGGCLEGAGWVDLHPTEVSEVVVVRRGGGVGYRNRSEDSKWATDPKAREGLEEQRRRGLTREERELAGKDLTVLEGLVAEREVERTTVEELRGWLRELNDGDNNREEELEQLDIDAFVKGGTPQEQPKQKSTKEILDEIEFDDDDDINFYNTCSCCR